MFHKKQHLLLTETILVWPNIANRKRAVIKPNVIITDINSSHKSLGRVDQWPWTNVECLWSYNNSHDMICNKGNRGSCNRETYRFLGPVFILLDKEFPSFKKKYIITDGPYLRKQAQELKAVSMLRNKRTAKARSVFYTIFPPEIKSFLMFKPPLGELLHTSHRINFKWGLLRQKQVSRARISNYMAHILWDVITYPCPRYLFLAHRTSNL